VTFLTRYPHCLFCARAGRRTLATVVDHIRPHRGDQRLFWAGNNLQALCKPCHDSTKKHVEAHGYSPDIGLDGLPLDPQHPANRGGS
jgi:5-methylcytosine-specific restriction endonuclease McrA